MLEVASIWVVCSPPAHVTQTYLSQNPANQAQHKWLVLPSVPGGSETQLHCVTLLAPNEGLKGKALGSRGILADESFFHYILTAS